MLSEDLPEGSNILGCRCVLTLKDSETAEPVFKARYVVLGHLEKDKKNLVDPTTPVKQSSIRLMTALAALFGLRIWAHNVSQAYLQIAHGVMQMYALSRQKY